MAAIARLVRSADFERVLRTRTRASSQHFAVHYVSGHPSVPAKAVSAKLSTGEPQLECRPVDDSDTALAAATSQEGVWLGVVVPKRHARRSVTRTLLKREIRAAMAVHSAALASGLWVVRLRAPFDRARFVSAASDELKRIASKELEGLIGSVAAERVAVCT